MCIYCVNEPRDRSLKQAKQASSAFVLTIRSHDLLPSKFISTLAPLRSLRIPYFLPVLCSLQRPNYHPINSANWMTNWTRLDKLSTKWSPILSRRSDFKICFDNMKASIAAWWSWASTGSTSIRQSTSSSSWWWHSFKCLWFGVCLRTSPRLDVCFGAAKWMRTSQENRSHKFLKF